MEEMLSKELEVDIELLAKIVPSISKLTTPLLNIANEEQVNKGGINLKQVLSYPDDVCQSIISVNARTNEFHTGNDSAHTIISISK